MGATMRDKQGNVDAFLSALNHPQEGLIQELRAVIRGVGSELTEGIKWNAPSYALGGKDIITLNFHYADYVTVVFHTGPEGKDTHTKTTLFVDDTGLLDWAADKRALLKIPSVGFLHESKDEIEKVIALWIGKARKGFQ
jgi:uncharacterized protein YdeI (YjbR/CyaY-like superfamily)